jgi:hypothetical protein
MREVDLDTWWETGKGQNAWTTFQTKTGKLSVYVRRNAANHAVIEIASISTISGWGGIRSLYRDYLADKPAIAENLLNPELDAMLIRWGWTHAYRDLADIPTRVNKKFEECFPNYANEHSAFGAVMRERIS